MSNVTLRLLLALLLTAAAFAKTSYAQTCDRLQVRDAYRVGFAETQTTLAELAWTGDAATCQPGEPSAIARTKAQTRLNYIRAIVGLPAVSFDSTLSAKAQAAALMMHAQGALNHFPDSSYACYTEAGRQAAGKSNLYLGRWGAAAIIGYVEDPGVNNGPLGHRRWILYPRAKSFGHGFTDRADALWVIGANNPRPADPAFVAWPNAGFHPIDLVFPRWSFALPGAGWASAKVSMTDPSGQSISLTQLAPVNGYGDNTLAWEPVPGSYPRTTREDLAYTVRIDSVKVGSEFRSFSYTVTMFDPTGDGCAAGQVRDAQSCACRQTSAVGEDATAAVSIVYLSDQQSIAVRGDALGLSEVAVYDLLGRRLVSSRLDGEGQVDLPVLASGVYVARLRNMDGREVVLKFWVE